MDVDEETWDESRLAAPYFAQRQESGIFLGLGRN